MRAEAREFATAIWSDVGLTDVEARQAMIDRTEEELLALVDHFTHSWLGHNRIEFYDENDNRHTVLREHVYGPPPKRD